MSTLQESHDIDLELATCNNGGGGSGGGGPHISGTTEIVGVPENTKSKHERKESSVSECSVEIVDVEAGGETKLHLAKYDRDCRICHLSMDAANQDSGIPIELGCSCKEDLAAAHKHCAEAWFKIKGNNGWNSTLESIAAGMPMICWPYFADQMINSRFVSDVWKVGLDIKDSCDRVFVENKVREMIMGERRDEFLERAKNMAELANKAISEGGTSYDNLDRLIEFVKSSV